MAIVRGGKQRGHIPSVGRVLSGQGTVISPPLPCTHSSDVAKLKKRKNVLTRLVNMFMKLFRSDDKFSQMLTQLESQPEIGGGRGDDEPGDDEDGGEDGEVEDDSYEMLGPTMSPENWEDMNLDVRAGLKGWKFLYLGDLLVKSELPSTFKAGTELEYIFSSFVRKIIAHMVTFFFFCVVLPLTILVPEVEVPVWGAIYIPCIITTLNSVGTPRSIHLLFYWILFENVMSLHRTKATFIGLLDAKRSNEWVVTEKLGDALKNKSNAKAKKFKFNFNFKFNFGDSLDLPCSFSSPDAMTSCMERTTTSFTSSSRQSHS
ncbi:hypothetical protein Tco_0457805 [Tanacetum coccineum]